MKKHGDQMTRDQEGVQAGGRWRRPVAAGMAAGALCLLGGCFPRPDYTSLPDAAAIRAESRTTTVPVRDPAHLSMAEQAAIRDELAVPPGTGVRVRVLLPPGAPPPAPGTAATLAAGLGIPPRWLTLVPEAAPGPTARVDILHVTASAPDCRRIITPNEAIDTSQRPTLALGCATYTNLAAQVADPADLVAPVPYAGVSATPASAAIDRYLADKVTPPPNVSAESNNQNGGGGGNGGSGN